MAIDCFPQIAIVSANRYRADSLALALGQESRCHPQVVPSPEVAQLARFPMILIEIDGAMEAALQLTHGVVTQSPDAKVILLGLAESAQSVVRLAEVGASGYASPSTSLQELIAIMHSAQKGEFICTPAIAYTLFSHLAHLASARVVEAPPSGVLTARERQVLELISQSFSNKEIAERLSLSTYTIKNHVHRILKKLRIQNRGHAFRYFHSELSVR
jgi:DNA-binding NarL/FixJ family response regulator